MRLRAVGAVVAGVSVGTLVWIIEAFLRFGGPVDRLLTSSNATNAGLRLRLVDQLHASDGPYTLCSSDLCDGVTAGMAVWWIGLPLLAIAGTVAARRGNTFLPMFLAFACATFFALPLLTFVGDSHPRFLIGAYGLLSIGLAYALLSLLTAMAGRTRWLAAATAAMVVGAQATVHYEVLQRVLEIQNRITDRSA